MKTIYQILTIILLVSVGTAMFGQNASNDFTAIVLANQDSANITSAFVKKGNDLVWRQSKGTSSKNVTFSITNVHDLWNQTTSTGEIIIDAVLNGYQIRFTLTSGHNGITAKLLINHGSSSGMQTYDFNINTISYD